MSPASLMNVGLLLIAAGLLSLLLGCSPTWKSRAVLEALASDNGLIEALLRREFAPVRVEFGGTRHAPDPQPRPAAVADAGQPIAAPP
jgi:hypothetical protein